jgi:peptidyl-prolyl cis-trans isomerase D
VRKAPADFAKIAKAKSEDPGSAEQGGDLGVIEKGLLVPPVEAPSTSSSRARSAIRAVGIGFHIVTVTELKPAVAKPLTRSRRRGRPAEKQKASKKYSEMAEAFTNTVRAIGQPEASG